MKPVVDGVVRAFGRGRMMRVCAGLAMGLLATTRADAQFTRVSVGLDGAQPNAYSTGSRAMSADGRFVAFTSDAHNLVSNDTNGAADVFVRDRQTSTTTRVSVATDGTQFAAISNGVALSATGQFVLFASKASLVSPNASCLGGREDCFDLYVRDRQANTTTRVSVKPDGSQFEFDVLTGDISADGRFVVFVAIATPANGNHVFLHDRQTATTTQISPTHSGAVFNYGNAAISDDGGTAIFRGPAPPDPSQPDPQACPACLAVTYVYTRATGAVTTILPAFASVHAERVPPTTR